MSDEPTPEDLAPTAHRRRPRRESAGIVQSPWGRLTNPFRPVEILSADQVEAIHRASLRIIAEKDL
jgi:trimethylamine--corrinoid protein Co-methyltransferase